MTQSFQMIISFLSPVFFPLKGLCRIASIVVQVNLTITVPGEALSLPLASDPSLSVSVSPPVAHWGPGPVNMRLISHTLRKGQVCVCVFYRK